MQTRRAKNHVFSILLELGVWWVFLLLIGVVHVAMLLVVESVVVEVFFTVAVAKLLLLVLTSVLVPPWRRVHLMFVFIMASLRLHPLLVLLALVVSFVLLVPVSVVTLVPTAPAVVAVSAVTARSRMLFMSKRLTIVVFLGIMFVRLLFVVRPRLLETWFLVAVGVSL